MTQNFKPLAPRRKFISAAKSTPQLVVLGCSAGGIEALRRLLSKLPENFKPILAIVQHIRSVPSSNLAKHFASVCKLPTLEVEDKQPLLKQNVFFAPANYHILVGEDGMFHLSVDAPVHFARPSIDVLFESAAEIFKEGVTGIVLTGANDDGAAGLASVMRRGGRGLIQDPQEASYPTMPEAALVACPQAEVLTLDGISEALGRMT